MTVNMAPTHTPRFWLITSPRTASNLLVKILNLDAQNVRPAENGGYFFLQAAVKRFSFHDTPLNTWKKEDRDAVYAVQQEAFDKLQEYLAAAEQEGQRVFVKEHAFVMNDAHYESEHIYGPEGVTGQPGTLVAQGIEHPTRSALNLTALPDEFLKTWRPTFLIRHPAMMLPSLYRTCIKDDVNGFVIDGRPARPSKEPIKPEVTMKWIMALYNFYTAHFGENSDWPIVLDADDIMLNPQIVTKYASLVGFELDKLRFEWEKATEEKLQSMTPAGRIMLSSLNSSCGVDKGKVAGAVDIDAEAAKWRVEFGEEGGRNLEQWVREAMPDYLYLHAKRLRL
ncbi:hypothetical protein CHGG_00294 [Chaetomium globosum CBS 148.51]|uniref:Sulfotransferase domain-containing protein n=1 Tax=Chaetomium globosum (strain ATCC 6205 / CBS 148.51 / DSM 1962 / NBRC 6347 / NRRL 1970) TaxID=306901 RepID=Q2HHL0_CHAGB|nr:uncharacterized protein CHGG_00294 [Chaetomium globosum CBS 148.51]EAQ92059.1 hypothetical protein CHGG_00294 [Chaetomium globosum CBS 148.51]